MNRRKKVAVVGQAPSRTSDPAVAFSGARGRRNLEQLLGVPEGELHERTVCLNLLGAWPGNAQGKGDRFPMSRARRAARVVDLPCDAVLLVGLKVAEAFRVENPELFQECTVRGRPAMVVPHPSGVSLWWNDELMVRHGRRLVKDWLKKHGIELND